MTLRTLASLTVATLLATGSAAAQSADTATAAEPRSNSFSLGIGYSPRVGVWHRFSPRVQAGVEVVGRREASGDDDGHGFTSTQVGIAPAIKLYASTNAPLLPYVYGEASVSFGSARTVADGPPGEELISEQNVRTLGVVIGLGMDWFPVERVSVGGHAGLEAQWRRYEYESGATEFPPQTGSTIGTFNSGLRVHFYF